MTIKMAASAELMDPGEAATTALVAYLRTEADLAEQKAKSLREQANSLAAQYGITEEIQQGFELDPSQLPPLDDRGVPKYAGKKRGRKPKVRKRKANPNRRKRQHTAYTLFVQERHPIIKAQHSGLSSSKDVISIVAKEWASLAPQEKEQYKARALAMRQEEEAGDHVKTPSADYEDGDDDDDGEEGEEDEPEGSDSSADEEESIEEEEEEEETNVAKRPRR